MEFIFLSGFSFTEADDSKDSKGREGATFVPLSQFFEHSDIYLQIYSEMTTHIFLIALLVTTRQLLDKI